MDRTAIPFKWILNNIMGATRRAPLVIQAMCMRIRDYRPLQSEVDAFGDRLNEIIRAGGQIQLVQVYTVARVPAETYVGPLSRMEVDQIVETVERRTKLPTEAFYGPE